VVGGAGYLYGGIVGAAIFMILQDRLASLSAAYWQFWLGLLLVLLVLFARGGLIPLAEGLSRRLRDRRAKRGRGPQEAGGG
jgi:branched-chain amino acid transport system permease protein